MNVTHITGESANPDNLLEALEQAQSLAKEHNTMVSLWHNGYKINVFATSNLHELMENYKTSEVQE